MSEIATSDSFTGSVRGRFPAPDVARGFMLLLIALANVPFWMEPTNIPLSEDSAANQIWVAVRGALVDQRAYPLFAFLFGFGLMTMINRRVTHEITEGIPWEWSLTTTAWLIRRRGLWMLAIGAVHALVFAGDIIGTYGLAAIALAGLLTRKRYGVLWSIAGATAVLAVLMAFLTGYLKGFASALVAGTDSGSGQAFFEFGAWTPLISLFAWILSTPLTLLVSLVVPALVLGAKVADTTVISEPRQHVKLAVTVSIVGLGGAIVGSLPETVPLLMGGTAPVWATPLNLVAGFAGAVGWVALLALWAGGPPASGTLRGVRGFLANVGQRSMTAYVAQTVFFLVIFKLGDALGWTVGLGPAGGAVIAVVVWLVIAVLCQLLALSGRRGPMERLLRWLVAKGEPQAYRGEIARA